MKVLILGGSGMLGHTLLTYLRPRHDVWVTLRRPFSDPALSRKFDTARVVAVSDLGHLDALLEVFRRVKPDVVINCVGIVKQLDEAHDPVLTLKINSLLPHLVAEFCGIIGARLVHISTDCVFSGRKGNYIETDTADAEDLYGRTKFLGEVDKPHCITLRTSIIGRELERKSGLIEWFLSQSGNTIRGYQHAVYSGFTTLELSRIIEDVLIRGKEMSGTWHVSSNPITKYQLLCLAKDAFSWRGEIVPDDSFVCDRSLNSERFRTRMNFSPVPWDKMIAELALSKE